MRLAYLTAVLVLSVIAFLLEATLSVVKKLINALERDFP